ncbi:MAG: undecaprenyl-diphosphate phosphatase [Magnetovibrionaceae bacterium]
MTLLQLTVLALVQGITEFLPISSSGHLVLVPIVLDWPDQGQVLDVAVHVGTLGAVLLYFWRDCFGMAGGLYRFAKGKKDPGAKLALLVVLGTIPVIAAGFALNHYVPNGFRSLEVIGWTTLGFGLLLGLADKVGMTVRRVEHLGIADAILIGLAQMLALIPGTSRSGVTMTMARFLGMERVDAARFSMLLGIPAILGAGVLKGIEVFQTGEAALTTAVFTAAALAFVSALVAIALMMVWLRSAGFGPFVVYRILLGCGLLAVAYGFIG